MRKLSEIQKLAIAFTVTIILISIIAVYHFVYNLHMVIPI
jgi:hypothetical protein